MRITTWNVNGIRNPFGYQPWRDQRTFNGMFDILEADIVVMQELKIQRKDLTDDMVLVPGWDCYFSLPKHKKGYSGVAIYTRQSACAPIRAEEGVIGVLCPPNSSTQYCDLPEDQQIGGYLTDAQISGLTPASVSDDSKKIDAAALDAEGRCVILEFPAFVLFGVYSPANSNGLRDDFRYAFLTALDTRIRNLDAMGKRVILTGDLNVSRSEIETASAEDDLRKMGITHEEYISSPNRRVFNQLVEGGPVAGERDPGREKLVLWDICREFHPSRKGMYTHWEQKINARPGNYGSRIDYVLCSIGMKAWFRESNIQEGLMGSDHCPVYAVFEEDVCCDEKATPLLDIVNPPGMFKNGIRQRELNTNEVPALSGKLLPEFNRRRNIKDMFARKPSTSREESATESVGSPQKQTIQPPEDSSIVPSTYQSIPEENRGEGAPLPSQSLQAAEKPQSPDRKRSAPLSSPVRTVKRGKSNATSNPPPLPGKGQQSLKGFFKPKTTTKLKEDHVTSCQTDASAGLAKDATPPAPTALSQDTENGSACMNVQSCTVQQADSNHSSQTHTNVELTEESDTAESPFVFDPIVSKESWSRLFTRREAPRCESHSEPCIRLQSKKKGFNLGREFWMCARPLGPSGNKERGTQWRCTTFIWASDWQSATTPKEGGRGYGADT